MINNKLCSEQHWYRKQVNGYVSVVLPVHDSGVFVRAHASASAVSDDSVTSQQVRVPRVQVDQPHAFEASFVRHRVFVCKHELFVLLVEHQSVHDCRRLEQVLVREEHQSLFLEHVKHKQVDTAVCIISDSWPQLCSCSNIRCTEHDFGDQVDQVHRRVNANLRNDEQSDQYLADEDCVHEVGPDVFQRDPDELDEGCKQEEHSEQNECRSNSD